MSYGQPYITEIGELHGKKKKERLAREAKEKQQSEINAAIQMALQTRGIVSSTPMPGMPSNVPSMTMPRIPSSVPAFSMLQSQGLLQKYLPFIIGGVFLLIIYMMAQKSKSK